MARTAHRRRSERCAARCAAPCCLIAALPLLAHAAPAPVAPEQRATRIHVEKATRRMTLYRGEDTIGVYALRLGDRPLGHKQREGDERTPEGACTISGRNPDSRFHLSLRVSYPDADDRRHARQGGYAPGGDIVIHGGHAWCRPFDWTDRCIASPTREWIRSMRGRRRHADPDRAMTPGMHRCGGAGRRRLARCTDAPRSVRLGRFNRLRPDRAAGRAPRPTAARSGRGSGGPRRSGAAATARRARGRCARCARGRRPTAH